MLFLFFPIPSHFRFFFSCTADPRHLPALTPPFPTPRTSELPVSYIPQSAAPPPLLPVDLVTQMEPEPVWNARQVVPNARTIPESSYIVSPGDTLRGVGNSTGAGSATLANSNRSAERRVGQKCVSTVRSRGSQYH